MNLSEKIDLMNNASAELAGRLSRCLNNLRGPVPENTSGDKLSGSNGLCAEIDRTASKLNECMCMVGELEAITSPASKNIPSTNQIGGPVGYR